MKKGKIAAICLLAAWAIGGAVVVACGGDDTTAITTPDGGVDATPSATTTTTATSTATSQPDTGAPGDDDDSGNPDAGDAGPHGVWGFNAYCDDNDPADAGCGLYTDCPSFEGGIATRDCDTPNIRCVTHAAADSGVKDRVFLCETTATNAWELNRICSFEDCSDVDAAACSNEAGVGGLACDTARERCIAGNGRVFICQPNTGLVEVFNGYCDAGDGIMACPDAGPCVMEDGGAAGESCTTDFARCVDDIDGGGKLFVCGDRSP